MKGNNSPYSMEKVLELLVNPPTGTSDCNRLSRFLCKRARYLIGYHLTTLGSYLRVLSSGELPSIFSLAPFIEALAGGFEEFRHSEDEIKAKFLGMDPTAEDFEFDKQLGNQSGIETVYCLAKMFCGQDIEVRLRDRRTLQIKESFQNESKPATAIKPVSKSPSPGQNKYHPQQQKSLKDKLNQMKIEHANKAAKDKYPPQNNDWVEIRDPLQKSKEKLAKWTYLYERKLERQKEKQEERESSRNKTSATKVQPQPPVVIKPKEIEEIKQLPKIEPVATMNTPPRQSKKHYSEVSVQSIYSDKKEYMSPEIIFQPLPASKMKEKLPSYARETATNNEAIPPNSFKKNNDVRESQDIRQSHPANHKIRSSNMEDRMPSKEQYSSLKRSISPPQQSAPQVPFESHKATPATTPAAPKQQIQRSQSPTPVPPLRTHLLNAHNSHFDPSSQPAPSKPLSQSVQDQPHQQPQPTTATFAPTATPNASATLQSSSTSKPDQKQPAAAVGAPGAAATPLSTAQGASQPAHQLLTQRDPSMDDLHKSPDGVGKKSEKKEFWTIMFTKDRESEIDYISESNETDRKNAGMDRVGQLNDSAFKSRAGDQHSKGIVNKSLDYSLTEDNPQEDTRLIDTFEDGTYRVQFMNGLYEGEIRDSRRNGEGSYLWNDGSKYSGEWKDDQKHGEGTFTWPCGDVYTGTYQHDKREGFGTKTYVNGDVYIGQWRDGRKEGQGEFTWANGDSYSGEFKNNLKDGIGIKTWINGCKYEGEWIDDRMDGYGEFSWPEGDTYSGQYLRGKRHGNGTKIWASGTEYSGSWIEDRREGYGILKYNDGRSHRGNFVNNLKHGEGEEVQPDGKKIIGIWANGKLLEQKGEDYTILQ